MNQTIETALKLKQEGFTNEQVTQMVMASVKTMDTATITEKKAIKQDLSFKPSDRAKNCLHEYNKWHQKINAGGYRQQRKVIVAELKQGETFKDYIDSRYNAGNRETSLIEKVAHKDGIVLRVKHYKGKGSDRELNFVDNKFLPYRD